MKKCKRSYYILIVVLMLALLTGCMPSEFTGKEEEAFEKILKKKVEAWMEENRPDAKGLECYVEKGFIGNGDEDDSTDDLFGYTLTDAMSGYCTISNETVFFTYIESTDQMLTDEYSDLAAEAATELYAEGLGFKRTEITVENSPYVYFYVTHKEYYDPEKDGTLVNREITKEYSRLPADLEKSEVKDYVTEGLVTGDLSFSLLIFSLNHVVDINELNLGVLRDYPNFEGIMIKAKNATYDIEIETRTIDGEEREVFVMTVTAETTSSTIHAASSGDATNASNSDATDTSNNIATPGTPIKSGTKYIFDAETLDLIDTE